jgi:hypothetical protein
LFYVQADTVARWQQANLRVLEVVVEIKTVPYVPLSHPFVKRLVGTLRRECLDRTGLERRLPDPGGPASPIRFASYRWQKHCRGLYQNADCRLIL